MPVIHRLSELAWPTTPSADAADGFLDVASRLTAVLAVAIWIGAGIWHSDAGAPAGSSSNAETAAKPARSTAPTSEYMVAAYGGVPYTYGSRVNLKEPGKHDFSVEPVEWRGEPFIDPIYYGVRVVRWFGEGRTGSMLDFTHSKAIAELQNEAKFKGLINGTDTPETTQKVNEVFKRLEFSHGHNMLTLNGLLRLADLHPRLSPYVGAGVGINLPHTEIQLQSEKKRTYEYQYTGPVLQGLVGLEFRLPRMSYFIEYKFSFASYSVPLTGLDGTKIGLFADLYRQAARWLSGETPAQGQLATDLASHQVIGGFGVRFAVRPAATAP